MEIDLNSQLVACLVETYGYPAPAVWGVYERVVTLCEELGKSIDPPILRVLAIASLTIGDLTRAHQLGEEFLKVYEQTGDPMIKVEGEYVLGVTHHWLGNCSRARTHLETALANYDPANQTRHISLFAQDPRPVCLVRLAWSLWLLGFSDQAIAALDQGVTYARSLHHPHTEGYALVFGAQVLTDMGRKEEAARLLQSLETLVQDYPMSFWNHRGQILRHCLAIGQRPAEECIAGVRQSMAAYDKDRGFICYSHFFCSMACAHLGNGDVESGLDIIEEAYDALKANDERDYLAEIHRIRAELLARGDHPSEEVESAFAEALTVARDQGAKSLELRSTLSLGRYRLSKDVKKKAEVHALVQDVYDDFTEGFDSPDLIDARAFLDG
jgi:predicted ATPase